MWRNSNLPIKVSTLSVLYSFFWVSTHTFKEILSLLGFHPFLPRTISLKMTVQFIGEYSVFILVGQKASPLCPSLCDTFCYWLICAAKKSLSDCIWFFLPCWACLERAVTKTSQRQIMSLPPLHTSVSTDAWCPQKSGHTSYRPPPLLDNPN